MSAKNDVTGDSLKSKTDNQDAYATGWDLIWAKKDKTQETKDTKQDNEVDTTSIH